jgi:hypothetical protein
VLVNRCGMYKKEEESIDHFFIVREPNFYGMPFLVVLAWLGLCLGGLRIFCIVGGRWGARAVLWFGRWYRFVLCGAFGGKGMGDFLRTPKKALKIFYIPFLLLSSCGQLLG